MGQHTGETNISSSVLARLVLHWTLCSALTFGGLVVAYSLLGRSRDLLGAPLWASFGVIAALCFSLRAPTRLRRAGQVTCAALTFALALAILGWGGHPYPFWICVVAAHLSATLVFHLRDRLKRTSGTVRT